MCLCSNTSLISLRDIPAILGKGHDASSVIINSAISFPLAVHIPGMCLQPCKTMCSSGCHGVEESVPNLIDQGNVLLKSGCKVYAVDEEHERDAIRVLPQTQQRVERIVES